MKIQISLSMEFSNPLTGEARNTYESNHMAGEAAQDQHTLGFGFWKSTDKVHGPRDNEAHPDWTNPVATPHHIDSSWLAKFIDIQNSARWIAWGGPSDCRICGKSNDSLEYVYLAKNGKTYKWPQGYVHYLKKHRVAPDKVCLEMVKAGLF